MTSLEWKIYEFLKEKSEKGEWIKMKPLAVQFGISTRALRKAIISIKENETIQKIVLSDYSKGYKLMSESDDFILLKRKKYKALKELKRYWLDVKRYNLNHQTKLTFDTQERDFFESLIKA